MTPGTLGRAVGLGGHPVLLQQSKGQKVGGKGRERGAAGTGMLLEWKGAFLLEHRALCQDQAASGSSVGTAAMEK